MFSICCSKVILFYENPKLPILAGIRFFFDFSLSIDVLIQEKKFKPESIVHNSILIREKNSANCEHRIFYDKTASDKVYGNNGGFGCLDRVTETRAAEHARGNLGYGANSQPLEVQFT